MYDSLPPIYLNPRSERRIKRGHCWVYSNEVDIARSNFQDFYRGQMATLLSATGEVLGSGHFNPRALLCGRLYSRRGDSRLDDKLLLDRVAAALRWRSACYEAPFYRLIYGDGDQLPGLVVDRYGEVLVLQVTSAGMMALLDSVVSALVDVVAPAGILLRNDSDDTIEGLFAQTTVLYGDVPSEVSIEENGVRFDVPVISGQKTGWFYDHRESRALLARYARGKRVLDVYSYLGAWGLPALFAGAESLCCIDRSASALALAERAAREAGVAERFSVHKSPAIEALKSMIKAGRSFDVVVLDPPAFIKRRKDQRSGEKAYHHINQLAVKLLAEQGLLVSASCSLHLSRDSLSGIIQTAAHRAGRSATIVYQGGLSADHPVNAAMAEMDYLKAVFARIE